MNWRSFSIQPLAAAELLGDRPSQLVRHQGAGRILVGIGRLQRRVHDGDGIRQGPARLVMVGDDQIDAELRATSAASNAAMPQSTVISRRVPASAKDRTASQLRP